MKRFFTLILASLMLVSCAATTTTGQSHEQLQSQTTTAESEKPEAECLESLKTALKEAYTDCKKNDKYLQDYIDKANALIAAESGIKSDAGKAEIDTLYKAQMDELAEYRLTKYNQWDQIDIRDVNQNYDDFEKWASIYSYYYGYLMYETGYIRYISRQRKDVPENILLYPFEGSWDLDTDINLQGRLTLMMNDLSPYMADDEYLAVLVSREPSIPEEKAIAALNGLGIVVYQNVKNLPENTLVILFRPQKHQGIRYLEGYDGAIHNLYVQPDWSMIVFSK